jgi:hypothetical protein
MMPIEAARRVASASQAPDVVPGDLWGANDQDQGLGPGLDNQHLVVDAPCNPRSDRHGSRSVVHPQALGTRSLSPRGGRGSTAGCPLVAELPLDLGLFRGGFTRFPVTHARESPQAAGTRSGHSIYSGERAEPKRSLESGHPALAVPFWRTWRLRQRNPPTRDHGVTIAREWSFDEDPEKVPITPIRMRGLEHDTPRHWGTLLLAAF